MPFEKKTNRKETGKALYSIFKMKRLLLNILKKTGLKLPL